jgi:ribosomal protein S18 acetylase RimI-like enzyme
LRHVERYAAERGAVSLSLLTAVDNRPARRLFRSSGYIELLRRPGVYAGNQEGVRMYKPLASADAE